MKASTPLYHTTISSPIGELAILATERGISGIYMETHTQSLPERNESSLLALCRQQLTAYFDRQLTSFDLPLDLQGTTFQLAVWHALLTIPYGRTQSYADIALQIGNPNAVRAVGLANGQNPVSIVVPCHRVIGKNGTLTGYGGGLERKRFLLDLEAGHGG